MYLCVFGDADDERVVESRLPDPGGVDVEADGVVRGLEVAEGRHSRRVAGESDLAAPPM